MPLATKNGSLIIKSGSIAENCNCCSNSCPRTSKPDSVTVVLSSTMTDRIVETVTTTRYFNQNGAQSYQSNRQTVCLLGAISGTYSLTRVPELDYEVIDGGVVSSHSIYSYKDSRIALSIVVTTGDYGLPYNGGSPEIRWRLFVFLTNVRDVQQRVNLFLNTLQPTEPLKTWTAAEILSSGAGQWQADPIITQIAAISLTQTCARDVVNTYGVWSGSGNPFSAERFLSYPSVQAVLPSVAITGQSSHTISISGSDLLVWDYFQPAFPIEVTGTYQKPGLYVDYDDISLVYYDAFGRLFYVFRNDSQQATYQGQTSGSTIPFHIKIESIRYVYSTSVTDLPL